jgi:thiol-disulfide isomerase/thioredoxin
MQKTGILFILLLSVFFTNAQTSLPDLQLKNMNGKTISILEMSKDKVIVIDFWATWCVPCINELDAIAEEYTDLQDEFGFELIAVSVDNARSKSRVKPMVNGKGWEYEILLDSNQKLKRALNISSVPYVIIVKNGKVVYTHSGYTPGAEEELFEKFKSFK